MFDSKCNWAEHMKSLVQRCSKRVNFLKSIAGASWGADPKNMLIVYKSTIRSILEYGAICFQTMAKSHLIKLERIQWRSIRICLGLMTSTHTGSCEVLTGIIPLQMRWHYLSNNHRLRSFSGPSPTYRQSSEELFNICPTHMLSVQNEQIIESVKNCSVFPCYYHGFEESLFSPECSLSIFNELKVHDTNDKAFACELFHKYARQNINTTFVYTDGSRSRDGTGSAVYVNEDISEVYRHVEPCNVFTAELFAIYSACRIILDLPTASYTIASDSMSSITSLSQINISPRKSQLFYDCKKTLHQLRHQGYEVLLLWIPAHSGIQGNESVDTLAKQASISNKYSERLPEWHQYKRLNKISISLTWQNSWTNGVLGRFCHSIINKVSSMPWYTKFDDVMNREEIRLVSRIVANHFCLCDHLNRINIVDSPLCQICNQSFYENPDHIFFTCEALHLHRESLIQNLVTLGYHPPYYVRDILSLTSKREVVSNLLNFLREYEITF